MLEELSKAYILHGLLKSSQPFWTLTHINDFEGLGNCADKTACSGNK